MLAVVIALIALLAPLGPSWGPHIVLSAPNNYVVDLGYQLNQGHTVVNDSLVTFRNIRYAAPPLGPLRFNAPTAPSINRTHIQNAREVICPQAIPFWFTTGAATPFTASDIPPVDPRTSEDCLFLDVLLPKSIWNTRYEARAPVIVWIHGGGFDLGWKNASNEGYGLVTRSQRFSSKGVILVSLNYRLGLFGWMSGPGVTPNVGLLDQRLAFEWVQTNIHHFGGDPSRVTILGESAGGTSVEAHIVAYGGTKRRSPFRGAIAQSPFYAPYYPLPGSLVDAVMSFGNVTSLATLRSMPSADLQKLNTLLVGNSMPYGTWTFSVVVDGTYLPDTPMALFQQGRFDHSLSVMTGHNQDEGSLFVPNTKLTNDSSYTAYFDSLFRPVTNNRTALDQLIEELYPPIFNGSQGYTTQIERNNLTLADAAVVCNSRYINQASFHSAPYAYEFSVPPAVHGADLPYTFYDFGDTPGINTTVAEIMQGYILRFAETGQPNAPGLPAFPRANSGMTVQNFDSPSLPAFPPASPGMMVQNLGIEGVGPMLDEGGIRQLEKRCQFWQDMPFQGEDSSAN